MNFSESNKKKLERLYDVGLAKSVCIFYENEFLCIKYVLGEKIFYKI